MNDEQNNLSCAVVRDLLPSYADGVTSEETRRQIAHHLDTCRACAETLARMKEPEAPAAPTEVDFLKKVRRRSTRKSLLVGIAMMVLGMGLILANVFAVGQKTEADNVNFTVSVENGVVYVSGDLQGSCTGFCRAVFSESAGMVNVTLYTAPKAFFNRSSFSVRYEAHGDVAAVRSGDLFLWEGGVLIDSLTARLYAAQSPFAGDMQANSTVAKVLGVGEQFGEYTNELQTEKEPYVWTLIPAASIDSADELAFRRLMTADSYVMLAVIENLGAVMWQYDTPNGPQIYTVTAEDANLFAGGDVKALSQTPSGLQSLVERLHFQ